MTKLNTSTGDQTSGKAKWLVLLVLCAAQVGTSGDNAVVGIAASELINGLGASMSDVQLSNAMFSLMTGAFMIAGGLLGLVFGWVRSFRIGICLLIGAEICGAFAPNIETFIFGARVMAGLGASLAIPAVLGIIAGTYNGKDQAIAFGGVAAASGIASAAMPLMAGLLIDSFGLSAAMLAMAVYFSGVLAASFKLKELEITHKPKIDIFGIVLCGIGLVLFIIGALKIPELGLWAPITDVNVFGISPAPLMIALGLVVLSGLYVWEGKFEATYGNCLLPKAIVNNKQVIVGLILGGAFWIGFATPAVVLVPHMQIIGGSGAMAGAIIGVSLAIGTVITSIIVPQRLNHLTTRFVCTLGLTLGAVAAIILSLGLYSDGFSLAFLIPGAVLMGVACGLMATQCSIIVTDALNEKDAQQSGGIQAAARNVGYSIGIAIMGVTMLLTMSNGFKSEVSDSSVITNETKQVIEQMPSINFLGDDAFEVLMSDKVSAEDMVELHEINATSRMESNRAALYSVAVSFLLMLFATRFLPNRSLMINKEETESSEDPVTEKVSA